MKNEEIKELRTSLNLTQYEFSSMLGVHYSQVYRWESGKGKIKNKGILSFLEVLKEVKKKDDSSFQKELDQKKNLKSSLALRYIVLKRWFDEEKKGEQV